MANREKFQHIIHLLGVGNLKGHICEALGADLFEEIYDVWEREGDVTWYEAFAIWLLETNGKRRAIKMMSASQEIGMILGIDAEARRLERERVLAIFASLADQMDSKADEDDGDTGLVWTAAAACIRRVCDDSLSGFPCVQERPD